MSNVSHRGRIIGITPETTSVEIISESACSACHAAGLCGLAEAKAKVIEVPTVGWGKLHSVGDEVEVVLKASMGHKAVWIAYVVPLFVLVGALLGLVSAGVGEVVAGLSAIGAVAVYYGIVYLLRDTLRNEYIFTIK